MRDEAPRSRPECGVPSLGGGSDHPPSPATAGLTRRMSPDPNRRSPNGTTAPAPLLIGRGLRIEVNAYHLRPARIRPDMSNTV
jgi:hypothetical protein